VPRQTDVTSDLTTGIIVSNVKDTEIIQVNSVTVFGKKDYSGNIQSIHDIRTTNAIYTINQGRIV
jgi:hypothetical protein